MTGTPVVDVTRSPSRTRAAMTWVASSVTVAAVAFLPDPVDGPPAVVPALCCTVMTWLFLRAGLRGASPAVKQMFDLILWVRVLLTSLLFLLWWLEMQAVLGAGYTRLLDMDIFRYDLSGWQLSRGLIGDYALAVPAFEQLGYSYFVSALYAVFGRSLYLLALANCLFGTLLALETYRLARTILDERAARVAAWLTALFPAVLLYSFLGLKDLMVAYLVLLLFRIFLEAARGSRSIVQAVVVVVVVYVLFEVRVAVVPVVALLAVIAILSAPRSGRPLLPRLVPMAALGVALAFGFAFAASTALTTVLGALVQGGTFVVGADELGGFAFTTGASDSLALSTYWGYDITRIYLIPVRAILILFVPPPVRFEGPVQILESLSVLGIAFLLPLALWSIHRQWSVASSRRQVIAAIWLPLVAILLGLAAVEPVLEARHRLQLMPFLVLAAVPGLRALPYSGHAILVAVPFYLLGAAGYLVMKTVI